MMRVSTLEERRESRKGGGRRNKLQCQLGISVMSDGIPPKQWLNQTRSLFLSQTESPEMVHEKVVEQFIVSCTASLA